MADFFEWRLNTHDFGVFTLLDAVAHRIGDTQVVSLFFDRQINPEQIGVPDGARLLELGSIGGYGIARVGMADGIRPVFRFDGHEHDVVLAQASQAFQGKNALAAVRNGESAAVVLDWVWYHVKHHGMTAAMVLDRAASGSDAAFAAELRAGMQARKIDCTLAVLSCATPLGKPDQPPESHPFCAPSAPGKDRMDVPKADAWSSPLGMFSIYELMRARGLSHARAVANIDVFDLLTPSKKSIFDLAVEAESGVVGIAGRHCYPYQTPSNTDAHFADHICVQFDAGNGNTRWCIAPQVASVSSVWRLVRVTHVGESATLPDAFRRCMALRHRVPAVSKIVPRTSLIEEKSLLKQSKDLWGHKPARVPKLKLEKVDRTKGRRAIVTTMKNEGPFILEWLAYHRAIGFDDFLVYTNDCSDGTDAMFDLLQAKGILQHRENPYLKMKMKPQHAALASADDEPIIKDAAWVVCIDVDEYINIKCGDGTLDALFAEVPDATMISMTWRLFGNAGIHEFHDRPIIEQYFSCAREFTPKPHQAWGFKTLYLNNGIFKKLGVHRPKGINPQLWEKLNWVGGSGKRLPRDMYRNSWRSTSSTYGYDLVQLNHYAVRSAESFLVKRDRGRVNHVDRDQGLAYWFRMNNNADQDRSIERMIPKMRAEMDKLLSDPEIAAAHAHSVACHRAKIGELKATENYAKFYETLTSARMEKLARLHGHFGANVFLAGPDAVPDEIVAKDPEEEWFFTVEKPGETQH